MVDETPGQKVPIFTTEETQATESGDNASKTTAEIAAEIASQYNRDGSSDELTPTGRPKRKYGSRESRGLPPVSRSGKKVDVAKGREASSYVLDKQIVAKTTGVVLNTIDVALKRKVYYTAIRLGGDKGFGEEIANNVGLLRTEAEMMQELTGIIFEKHGWLTGYAPEILLGVMLGEWGLRVALTMRTLNQMEADAKAREKKKQEDITKRS